MKFTIEMNVYEISRSIQSGTLEALVKDVQAYEHEVRNTNQTVKHISATKSETKEQVSQEPATEEQVKKPEKEQPSITIEDVRAAFMAKNSKANTSKLKAILNKFGAKKVTDLKEEYFQAVLEALEAI